MFRVLLKTSHPMRSWRIMRLTKTKIYKCKSFLGKSFGSQHTRSKVDDVLCIYMCHICGLLLKAYAHSAAKFCASIRLASVTTSYIFSQVTIQQILHFVLVPRFLVPSLSPLTGMPIHLSEWHTRLKYPKVHSFLLTRTPTKKWFLALLLCWNLLLQS